MEEKIKQIIAFTLIILIILAGLIVTNRFTFNEELNYKAGQKIDIRINQQLEEAKVKSIVNEVLGEKNIVQTVEIYKDAVTIKAESISEEQKNQIIEKLKEVYEFDQLAEDTEITDVSAIKIYDMYKNYILPFVIAEIIVVAYMAIRYYKKGILKTIAYAVMCPVLVELTFVVFVVIAKIPVGRFIPAIVLLLYTLSILFAINQIEKIKQVED